MSGRPTACASAPCRCPTRAGRESRWTLDVWDFGGQLEYRATQRFYLTDRSLFLLVWNSRARAADGKVTAWLDAITARAPGAPILLVATHGDEDSPATLPHDLPGRYPGIAAVAPSTPARGWASASCATPLPATPPPCP